MTGMEVVIALRRIEKTRPGAVFVYLVPKAQPKDDYEISGYGNVTVDIGASENLDLIDFRPLCGLQVHLCDTTESPERYRRLASLVASAEPSLLVMPVANGDGFTVHYRHAGGTTETARV